MCLCAIWAASRTSCVNILGVWYYRRQGWHADVSASWLLHARPLHTRPWLTSRGIGKGTRKSAQQLWAWNCVIFGFICWDRLLFRSFAGIFLTFLGKLPEALRPDPGSLSCGPWALKLTVFSVSHSWRVICLLCSVLSLCWGHHQGKNWPSSYSERGYPQTFVHNKPS